MTPPKTIDALVADLEPVRPLRARDAAVLVGATVVAASLAVAWRFGLREDILTVSPHPMVVLRLGTLLLLGLATGLAAIASVRPAVGEVRTGWHWTLAGALLFPLAALVALLWNGAMPVGALAPDYGRYCLQVSFASALLIGGALTLWLRRGASVRPELTGWLTGLAAGSFGTFAYSLHCPITNIYYIGLWYSIAVGVAAIAGRLIVPPLLRW